MSEKAGDVLASVVGHDGTPGDEDSTALRHHRGAVYHHDAALNRGHLTVSFQVMVPTAREVSSLP